MIFNWENGLIWISIGIIYEGKVHKIDNCIVDTGSATTAIDIDIIDLNYEKTTTIKRLRGIGGVQEVIAQQVESLTFENVEIKDIEIEFGDIKEAFGIKGFIGNDILSRFVVNINYFEKEISFKPCFT